MSTRVTRTPRLRTTLHADQGRSFRTYSAVLSLLSLLLLVQPAPGESAAAEDVPPLESAIPAWLCVRGWLDSGVVPDVEADGSRLPLERVSAVGVLLRLDGRVVGRGFDPDGDDLAVRRGFGRALAQALGDRTIRRLPEPWRSSPGSRLSLELELAGARQALVGGSLAAAARRLRPGIDGVAVVRGDQVAMAMPGRLLATGTADSAGNTLIRLLDEIGLPPEDLPQLRRIDSVRLERFVTLRIGQQSPEAMPETRARMGILVPRVEPSQVELEGTSATLRDRLLRWRPPPDPAQPDADRPWLGDFDPIAGTHDPMDAAPTDRMLAIWALRGSGDSGVPVPPPTEFDPGMITPALIDLALLAAGSEDSEAAQAWLEWLDESAPSEGTSPNPGERARRAAALGALATNVVPTERLDQAYEAAWDACDSLPTILAAFDWLCLAERSWSDRHGTPSPRITSLRAVRDSLLARQIDDPTIDLDGSIPLRTGGDEASDARCLRLLLGMAALATLPEEDADARNRAQRGLAGLVRFVRQLQVTPQEATDLPHGRHAVGGVQAGPADPRQPLVATSLALIAVELLQQPNR
jgi:hypothetical protein